MTTGFSRKIGISGEEKAEAKGEPAHELETDVEGPGLREWFDQLPKAQDGGKAAAFDTRLGSPLAGGAAHGIARRLQKHGYYLVNAPKASSLTKHMGRFAPARSSGQGVGSSVGTSERAHDHDARSHPIEGKQDPGPVGGQQGSGRSHLVATRSEGPVVRLGPCRVVIPRHRRIHQGRRIHRWRPSGGQG